MLPKYLDGILYGLFLILFPSAVWMSLYYPPVILEQGTAHRIFYFHVSSAWVALYAPFFSTLGGILYLKKKDLVFDLFSSSMAKMAMLFSIFVLFSGPIWANSAWGVPWDWTDARLQTFFVLVMSLFSYFVLRWLLTDPIKKAKISSILSIFVSINSILTWGAIRWVDNPGNHPGSVLGKGGMDPSMRLTFWINILAYHLLFWALFTLLFRKEKIEYSLEILRAGDD
ncbi:MAG: cytochrome c biogenesis protein CcsA [Leptospiraceae bacterium]|nr:cytochrome c biogenesis protein CcsA [Leptospiraceae bacterium]MCP5511828.1 cytochrome c biogenesis protein CcsA [Leptospiraceae bacterium]